MYPSESRLNIRAEIVLFYALSECIGNWSKCIHTHVHKPIHLVCPAASTLHGKCLLAQARDTE